MNFNFLEPDNKEFNQAVDFVRLTDKLIYLTGKAGTGKTTFLKYIKSITDKNTVILAPTGVAAINAGGSTIHSFFQIKPGPYLPTDIRLRPKSSPYDKDKTTIWETFRYGQEKRKILKALDLLIIDEISMVRCDLLDVIDKLMRVFCNRRPNQPFGGVQVLLIGDTFQLPPIAEVDQWDILRNFYDSPFFFSSHVIKNNQLAYLELKKIYRQTDLNFIDLLNRVRIGQVTDSDLKVLNSKYNPDFDADSGEHYITLATHKYLVDNTNRGKLNELFTETHVFECEVIDNFPDRMMPTERSLELKIGAQVMFLINDPERRYVNGTIGEIKEFDEGQIIVEISEDNVVYLERSVWYNIEYKWNEKENKIEERILGSFIQYPLRLAWAITVHKSQGLTFRKVIADLGQAFDAGQVYVALSRCTSLDGLVLKSVIDRRRIMTHPKVIDFAKTATPDTLLNHYLDQGKADFYYKKSRDNIKTAHFEQAFELFLKAIKCRDDIQTLIFRRIVLFYFNKLYLYKKLVKKLQANFQTIKAQLSDKDKEIVKLLELVANLNEKNDEYKTEVEKLKNKLKNKEKQLNDRERKKQKTGEEISGLFKTKTTQDQEILINENKNKEPFVEKKNVEPDKEEFFQKIQELERELNRLKDSKW